MDLSDALADAKTHTEKAWYRFTRNTGLKAVIPDWRTGTSPDGTPTLSVEVVGPGAAHALRRFADTTQYDLALGPRDLRPLFDVEVPGRTVLVWRYGGVWVQLWHPDKVANLPTSPDPAVARQGLLTRASGRLPFTRHPKTQTPA
jgi:hypothetical protein